MRASALRLIALHAPLLPCRIHSKSADFAEETGVVVSQIWMRSGSNKGC
jgi:hypothetical protein